MNKEDIEAKRLRYKNEILSASKQLKKNAEDRLNAMFNFPYKMSEDDLVRVYELMEKELVISNVRTVLAKYLSGEINEEGDWEGSLKWFVQYDIYRPVEAYNNMLSIAFYNEQEKNSLLKFYEKKRILTDFTLPGFILMAMRLKEDPLFKEYRKIITSSNFCIYNADDKVVYLQNIAKVMWCFNKLLFPILAEVDKMYEYVNLTNERIKKIKANSSKLNDKFKSELRFYKAMITEELTAEGIEMKDYKGGDLLIDYYNGCISKLVQRGPQYDSTIEKYKKIVEKYISIFNETCKCGAIDINLENVYEHDECSKTELKIAICIKYIMSLDKNVRDIQISEEIKRIKIKEDNLMKERITRLYDKLMKFYTSTDVELNGLKSVQRQFLDKDITKVLTKLENIMEEV